VTLETGFRELLGRVRETTLGAFAHQDLPFEQLLDELQVPRELSRTPLFSVFFNMVNLPFGEVAFPGLATRPLRAPELPSKFDLTVYVRELPDGLLLDLAYNAELFSGARMEVFLAQLRELLAQAAADPERPVGDLALRPPETAAVLPDPARPLDAGWNGAVHEIFGRLARRFPLAEAVRDPAGSWTYRDLDHGSARLAHRLVALGVRREDPVVVFAHRSAAMVWAVMGVLRAGGAFVALDPAYPPPRQVEILRRARPRVFLHLTAAGPLPAEVEGFLGGPEGAPVVALPPWREAEEQGLFADEPSVPPAVPVGPDDLAYISFTSGSTGEPKGILGRHGPLSHFQPWQRRRFGLRQGMRYSMLSGLAHDPLQRDLFTPLCLGGTVVIPDPAEVFAAGRLAAWMAREGIHVAHLTPAMGQVLAETGPAGKITVPSLAWVLLVGDALTRRDVERLEALAPNVTVVNLYGSTETQRAVGYHAVARGGAGEPVASEPHEVLPLGAGMQDVQLLVLNPRGGLAGVGEVGEIAVRSPHLARGYLEDPERTAERFFVNPWGPAVAGGGEGTVPPDRLYRTGDLGRYRPDGEVVFAGRADTQIKIRGFRVELSEIEGELGRLPGVREAVVVAAGGGAQRRLMAYLVAGPGLSVTAAQVVAQVKEALGQRLPAYMVPAAFVLLPALPLTPNGKVDRRALSAREPAAAEVSAMVHDPETETERLIAALIRETLGIPRVGIDENFFELGANSLSLVTVHGRLEEALGRKIPAVDLFSHPTVRELAAHLVPGESEAAAPPAAATDRGDKLRAGRERLAQRQRRLKGEG
jgi:amino acid adenylation domain-containing protein